jgi:hypothetical protein
MARGFQTRDGEMALAKMAGYLADRETGRSAQPMNADSIWNE